ncbi:acyl-CoA thioesterase [Calothrix sp. 336/3]|uniref:acyl-CoA thioesterase n=1 Tax=Calothrix sp. 336/3 TaxID=1337936 RepID=UPI0004E41512|nr:thioesterase family protein [Calothrix sp. 336/3]AKG23151.1 thioesterase superfamily protein [Calothrix sp. 336/3]
MSGKTAETPQIPPSNALDIPASQVSENWFEYLVKVHPHHTDYGGIVWHGTYLTWLEEARVECLRSIGVDFADLVALGCDLPVVDLSIRYHRSLQLGMSAIVKTRMHEVTGVRLDWDYAIVSADTQELYVTAKVTLVAVDRERGKIMRHLPANVKDALTKLSTLAK